MPTFASNLSSPCTLNSGVIRPVRSSSATAELTPCHLCKVSASASNAYNGRLRIFTLSGSISIPSLTFFKALCHRSLRSSPLVCDCLVRAKRSFSYVRVYPMLIQSQYVSRLLILLQEERCPSQPSLNKVLTRQHFRSLGMLPVR